jgi:hypothetical protein
MRINKRLLSKHDVEALYNHWAGVIWKEDVQIPSLSEQTGLTEHTLEKFFNNEVTMIPAEKILALFLVTETPLDKLLPHGFVPSGSREVEEVIFAAVNEYGPLPLRTAIQLIQDYFSTDDSWANEKILGVFENPIFHVEGGKIHFSEQATEQEELVAFDEN